MSKTSAEIEREIQQILASDSRVQDWRDGFKMGTDDAHAEIRNYGRSSARATLDQLKAMTRSDFVIGQIAGYELAIDPADTRSNTLRGVKRHVGEVTVDTGPYQSTHGAEPRGRGTWTFIIGKRTFDTNDDPALYHPTPKITYSAARDRAIAEAKRRGVGLVVVAP